MEFYIGNILNDLRKGDHTYYIPVRNQLRKWEMDNYILITNDQHI